jgi:hypothetical protein
LWVHNLGAIITEANEWTPGPRKLTTFITNYPWITYYIALYRAMLSPTSGSTATSSITSDISPGRSERVLDGPKLFFIVKIQWFPITDIPLIVLVILS